MSTLYNIIEEQRYTLLEIEELGGELTPELEQRLQIQSHQLQNKSIAYLEVIKQKEMFNDTIESEIKRLQAIKKQNDNLVSRLKDNLLNAVKTFGEYESGLNKFSSRKSQLIMVEDVNALPKEYKVIKVTEAADKIALKKAIQSGKEIEGVSLINNYNLKIN